MNAASLLAAALIRWAPLAIALSTGVGVAVASVVGDSVVSPLRARVERVPSWRGPSQVRVLDRHGFVIDTFGPQRREWVSIDAVPAVVIDAFVTAEDRRFWTHPGLDPRGIARAAWVDGRSGGAAEGGSTITQQVVKKLVVGDDTTLTRKAREGLAALLLERVATKREILELYLNLVYLGDGSYGIVAASRGLFGLELDELGPEHAAVLASMVPAPSAWSPRTDPAGAIARRNVVLRNLVDLGRLDPTEADELQSRPIHVIGPEQGPPATADAFRTQVRAEVRQLIGEEPPFELGLDLHTGFDPKIQAVAERAVRRAVDAVDERRRTQGKLGPRPLGAEPWCQGAAVVLDNATGEVRALVGGYDDPLGGLVRATQSRRQPGSAFKPFVYAAALEAGLSPRDRVMDAPLRMRAGGGEWWSHDNHSDEYRGEISLATALGVSSNTAAVRIADEVGIRSINDVAARLGVETPLRDDLSVALGSSEVTPMDMAVAYATLARGGVRAERVYIRRITTRDGFVLVRAGEEGVVGERSIVLPGGVGERMIAREVVADLTEMLEGVVRRGTGYEAFEPRQDRAGKTGTTNGYADVWFVGYTPRHTVAVWIGRDEPEPLGRRETGARTALPAWVDIVDSLGVPGRDEASERFPAGGVVGSNAEISFVR